MFGANELTFDPLLTSKHDENDTRPVMTRRWYHLNMETLLEDLEEMVQWGGKREQFVIRSVQALIVRHGQETLQGMTKELELQEKFNTSE